MMNSFINDVLKLLMSLCVRKLGNTVLSHHTIIHSCSHRCYSLKTETADCQNSVLESEWLGMNHRCYYHRCDRWDETRTESQSFIALVIDTLIHEKKHSSDLPSHFFSQDSFFLTPDRIHRRVIFQHKIQTNLPYVFYQNVSKTKQFYLHFIICRTKISSNIHKWLKKNRE